MVTHASCSPAMRFVKFFVSVVHCFPLVYLRIVSGSGCGPIRSSSVVGLVIRPLPSLGLHRTSAISSVILVNGLPSLITPVSVCLGTYLLSRIGLQELFHGTDLIEVLQD